MKKIFYLIALLSIILLSSCGQDSYDQQPLNYDPQAQYGNYNGNNVVYVRDNRGEQFIMDYILYQSLFNSGGYNSVSNYYYNHPNDYGHIYPYTNSFRPVYGGAYNSIHTGFYNNYRTAYSTHRIYTPSSTIINNSTRVRVSHYGNSYRPTVRTTQNATTYHNNGSMTRSTYKNTYHANGSVTQRAYHTTYHSSGSVSRSFSSSRRR